LKLKSSEIRDYRIRQLGIQDYACALCGEDCDPEEAVLDHDHKTGMIRQVLHRGCNCLVGHIENNMPRNRITMQRLEKILLNTYGYLTTEHTELIHPTFKTPEERKMAKSRGKGRGKGRGR
jgi:hypothetical protein